MQINTKDVIWKWREIPSFTLSLSGSTALSSAIGKPAI